jgi:hypothetical protein
MWLLYFGPEIKMRNNAAVWKQVVAVVVALFVIPVTTPGAGTAQSAPAPPQMQPQVRSGAKPPTVDQVLSTGLWRVDGSFQSRIQIYNRHILLHRTIIPVLYMADGTEYYLPLVDVAPNTLATVNVNEAIKSAPPQVSGHVSLYGSASVHFLAPTTGGISAAMQIIDAANSLNFTYPFHAPDRMDAMQHTFDGLWWRRDSGITGFVGLANRTSNSVQVSLQAMGAAGAATTPQTVVLRSHATELLSLDDLTATLPANQKLMGGLRLVFTGKSSDVMITGGLENQTEGYSALIAFYMHDPTTAAPSPVTLASTGIMVGHPDPAMKFPNATVFFPYTYLWNASSSPLKVNRALYYTLAGGSGQRVNLPSLTINAGGAVQVPLDFGSVGLGGYNGQITETFSTVSNPGDLAAATGSTDQTANYVFEVLPQLAATTKSKQDEFWRVGGGYDTMTTLWNSGTEAEDLLVKFSFEGGKAHYKLPVHLAPGAAATIDMAEIISEAKPDADGNFIPSTASGGGMIVSGPADFLDDINVVVSGGIFSVFGATCGPVCYSCGPSLESLDISVASATQMTATATFSNGEQINETSSSYSTWSSNNTSVATVATGGIVTAVATGSANAQDELVYSDGEEVCEPNTCPIVHYGGFAGLKIVVSSFGLQFQDSTGCTYFPTCTGTCTNNGFHSPLPPNGVCPTFLFCADLFVLGTCLVNVCAPKTVNPNLCS